VTDEGFDILDGPVARDLTLERVWPTKKPVRSIVKSGSLPHINSPSSVSGRSDLPAASAKPDKVRVESSEISRRTDLIETSRVTHGYDEL